MPGQRARRRGRADVRQAEHRPVLVAVTRGPDGLKAQISVPVQGGLCRIRATPLVEVAAAVCPRRDELLARWRELDAGGARAAVAARALARVTTREAPPARRDPLVVRAAGRWLAGGDGRPSRVDWKRALAHPEVCALLGAATHPSLPWFEMLGLPLVTTAAERTALVAAWHALGLEHEPGLREQVLAFVVRRSSATWQAWLRLLPHVHPGRREILLMTALHLGVDDAPRFDAAAVARCAGERGVHVLVEGLARGLRLEEILVGLDLGVERLPEFAVARRRPRPSRPEGWWAALAEWVEVVSRREAEPAHWGAWLWLRCLGSPALGRRLLQRFWRDHSLDVTRSLLTWCSDDAPDSLVGPLLEAVARTPETHRLRLIGEVGEILTDGPGPRALRETWAVRLAESISAPPAAAHARTARAVAALLVAADREKTPARVLEIPARTLRLLDEAVVRDDRAQRLFDGLDVLSRAWPRLVLDAAMQAPRALVKTAVVVGTLPSARARALLRKMEPDASRALPRRLRLARAGAIPLSEASAARHERVGGARSAAAQMTSVREAVLAAVSRGLPLDPSDAAQRHAALLLASTRGNRAALVRHVRAGFPRRARHPANAAWLRRRPAFPLDAWLAGFAREVDVPGVGTVRLAVEDRPLEVLRLGTYVGTCVSLGSFFQDTAAAWVLDVNKQVVYARRVADGSVVARQTLSVTDEDHLAVGSVYPYRVSEAVAWEFLAYDLEVSERLGLPLATTDDGVRAIVARDVLRDGVWDVVAPQLG